MNPAALKANKNSIKKGGTIIVNIDSFEKRDLEKAGYETSPLEDNSFEGFNIIESPITSLTREISFLEYELKKFLGNIIAK